MRCKIVAGNLRDAVGPAIFQNALYAFPINRAGMIEIDAGTAGRGEGGAVAVKIIERKARGGFAQQALQLVGEPGLARGAAADDGYEQRGRFGFFFTHGPSPWVPR